MDFPSCCHRRQPLAGEAGSMPLPFLTNLSRHDDLVTDRPNGFIDPCMVKETYELLYYEA
jgi:hypothetical protein